LAGGQKTKDEGCTGDDKSSRPLTGRQMLRIHLHEYLSLLTLVKEEWQAIETRLAATARQLNC
jgi:hypothetical protein